MDRINEIKVELEKLGAGLEDFESNPKGLEKEFTFIEGLIIETLMDYDKNSDVTGILHNFVVVAHDVKAGVLNVEVDYSYICKEIGKILRLLDNL